MVRLLAGKLLFAMKIKWLHKQKVKFNLDNYKQSPSVCSHNVMACKALHYYEKQADKKFRESICKIADRYGVTTADMNKHWNCVENKRKC